MISSIQVLEIASFVMDTWGHECGREILLHACMLINKTYTRFSGVSVHQQFVCSVMMASKWLDDDIFPNNQYASHFSINQRELNVLERAMFRDLGFTIIVSEKDRKTFVRDNSEAFAYLLNEALYRSLDDPHDEVEELISEISRGSSEEGFWSPVGQL